MTLEELHDLSQQWLETWIYDRGYTAKQIEGLKQCGMSIYYGQHIPAFREDEAHDE